MFRILGCLAMAMTAGAALLTWMEPLRPSTAALTDPAFSHARADEVIRLAAGVHRAPWETIDIVSVARSPDAMSLAATTENQYHFTVSDAGVVQANGAWRRQHRYAANASAIVIGVDVRDMTRPIPIREWIGLRALLIALADQAMRDDLGIDLGVRVRMPAARLDNHYRATLRAWLEYDGFLPEFE